MTLTKFDGIGTEIDLPKNCIYHDDGFVDDTVTHSLDLILKYKGITSIFQPTVYHHLYLKYIKKNNSREGCCLAFKSKGLLVAHIFYQKSSTYGGDLIDAFVRAHEESHAIDFFDKNDCLSDVISRDLDLNINLSRICDPETKANIGGTYGFLKKTGYSLAHLERLFEDDEEILVVTKLFKV